MPYFERLLPPVNNRNNRGKKNIFHGKRSENGNMQHNIKARGEGGAAYSYQGPISFLGLCVWQKEGRKIRDSSNTAYQPSVISDTIICLPYKWPVVTSHSGLQATRGVLVCRWQNYLLSIYCRDRTRGWGVFPFEQSVGFAAINDFSNVLEAAAK